MYLDLFTFSAIPCPITQDHNITIIQLMSLILLIGPYIKTDQCVVIGCKLKQNANEGCNSCASLAGLVLSFIACITLLVIAP